jgi:SRSO17 transposase
LRLDRSIPAQLSAVPTAPPLPNCSVQPARRHAPTDLLRTAKIRWWIEHDYRELKPASAFEGRSFTGWHHHVTLVTAAHLFITMLRHDPKADAPA